MEGIEAALARFKGKIPQGVKWRRYKELTMMRHTLVSQVSQLSSKLRLTPQNWIDPATLGRRQVRQSKQRPAIGGKVWDSE